MSKYQIGNGDTDYEKEKKYLSLLRSLYYLSSLFSLQF